MNHQNAQERDFLSELERGENKLHVIFHDSSLCCGWLEKIIVYSSMKFSIIILGNIHIFRKQILKDSKTPPPRFMEQNRVNTIEKYMLAR